MLKVRNLLKYILILPLVFSSLVLAGENIVTDKESFAQEYAQLGLLLEKIQDEKTARFYKPQVIKELDRIRLSVGEQSNYEALSPEERKLFIKKFQNNNLHCGYVTKVANERNRLLLNKEAKNELGELLDQLLD
jgi:hypothetical protein